MRIFASPSVFANGPPEQQWKQAIKAHSSRLPRLTGEIAISVKLYLLEERTRPGRNDLDNFLKPILDALDEVGSLDEHRVALIQIERIRVSDPGEEGADIHLAEHKA